MATTKKATATEAATVSHAKPLDDTAKLLAAHKRKIDTTKQKAEKKKPTKQEAAAAAVAKMRQASLAIAPIAAPSELVMMPLTLIEAHAQVRKDFDEAALAELAADVATRGVLQPVLLRPAPGRANFVLIAGERRFRAAKLAGLDCIPAIVGNVDDDTASAMQIAENIQREDLSLADTAAAVQKLYEMNNNSVTDVAAKLHKSKSWVSKHLAASHPDLAWQATNLLKDGITEDLEIVLIVDKIAKLSYNASWEIDRKIRAGEAGRQTVREYYEKLKADIEARKAEQTKKANTDDNDGDNEETEEERAEREKREKETQAQLEKMRLDPMRTRWTIDRNANSDPDDLEEIAPDQMAALAEHLEKMYKSGRNCDAQEYRNAMMQMIAADFVSDGYAMIELAAFTAGYCDTGEGFDPAKLIEDLNKNVREVC